MQYDGVVPPWQEAYAQARRDWWIPARSPVSRRATPSTRSRPQLAKRGLGKKRVQYRLRDWGISRQRYWGCPIPIIHCSSCGDVPVPDSELPVRLPEDLVPDGSGNPLAQSEAFLQCRCPRCGQDARRETDTMDTFVDSSWYFLRFASHDSAGTMVDSRANYWMPVDQYIGGIEHAILHLLYARFWTRVMHDLDLVRDAEPFAQAAHAGHGAEPHLPAHQRGGPARILQSRRRRPGRRSGPRARSSKSDGSDVTHEGLGTMSKSRNNGVDPNGLVQKYGADTARLFMMFTAPPEQSLEWSDEGVQGAHRFLRRLWKAVHDHVSAAGAAESPRTTPPIATCAASRTRR